MGLKGLITQAIMEIGQSLRNDEDERTSYKAGRFIILRLGIEHLKSGYFSNSKSKYILEYRIIKS